jgi:hypothetical protein
MSTRFICGALACAALAACATGTAPQRYAGFDSDAGASGDDGSPGASSGGGSGGGGLAGDGGVTQTGQTVLYAHDDTTLYQLDPANLTAPLQLIGAFDCIGSGYGSSGGGSYGGASSMTDLAVTKDGRLFGVSEGAAYPLSIQGGVVHCMSTWNLPQTKFYGLTIAPAGVLGSNEVLIGADGMGGIYEIDQNSGTPTQVGTLGTDPQNGRAWELSGDVVFLANGGNPFGYATVRTCSSSSSCSSTDTLIEVDVHAIHPGTQSVMKRVIGQVVRGSWCTNPASPATFGSMFGVAAYEDKVFGFSREGDIVEIHNADGTGCLVSAQPSIKFAGAGVTTAAPVVAPTQ